MQRTRVPLAVLFLVAAAPIALAQALPDVANLQRDCEAGKGRECFLLWEVFTKGLGVAPDAEKAKAYRAKAVELWTKGCEANEVESCMMLGNVASQDGAEPTALTHYTKACELGSGGACRSVATAYKRGHGVKKDKAKTAEFFTKSFTHDTKACAAENWIACLNVGWLYMDGEGVKQDQAKAGQHFIKACDKGVTKACDELTLNPWLRDKAAKP